MADNHAASAHQNNDHSVQKSQENPQEDTPSHAHTDNPPTAGVDGKKTPKKSSPQQPKKSVVVRYGLMRQIGEFRQNLQKHLPRGAKVVVRTERGVELGEVVINVKNDTTDDSMNGETRAGFFTEFFIEARQLDWFIRKSGSNYPFRRNGKLLRIANQQDIIDYRHLKGSACEKGKYARDQIKQRKLAMKIIAIEHILGGGRIIFHFTSESRVDFRELVRDLASQFRTRIEMRQVGARDEAALVADYERCGQRCCCQEYLKYLKPVSMRMAKVQKATLDPAKISGRCGRLMCCLRYEDATYEELRKKLPRRNTTVRTAEVTGKIIDTQIITQLVRLLLPDGTQTVVPLDDIVEYDVKPVSEKTSQDSCKRQENFGEKSHMPRRRTKDDYDDNTPAVPMSNNRSREGRKRPASHIENAPELPALQDDAITPISRRPQSEPVDAEPDSIPLSELFGTDSNSKLWYKSKEEEKGEVKDGAEDEAKRSFSDDSPRKRKRRGRRRRRK